MSLRDIPFEYLCRNYFRIIQIKVNDEFTELIDNYKRTKSEIYANKLLNIIKPNIYNIACAISGTNKYSDDITQDVLIILFKKIDSFKYESKYLTYVYAITRNVTYKYLNKNKKDILKYNKYVLNNNKEKVDKDLVMSVKMALNQLNDKYRVPLLLKEYDNYSYEEIGKYLDIKIGTVKSRIFYAREKLIKILNKYGGFHED